MRVASRVAELLKEIRKLGKFRIMSKLHGIIYPSTQSSPKKENFVSTSKRLLENRN